MFELKILIKVTVWMNMVILLLMKHSLQGLRDKTSLEGKNLKLTSLGYSIYIPITNT